MKQSASLMKKGQQKARQVWSWSKKWEKWRGEFLVCLPTRNAKAKQTKWKQSNIYNNAVVVLQYYCRFVLQTAKRHGWRVQSLVNKKQSLLLLLQATTNCVIMLVAQNHCDISVQSQDHYVMNVFYCDTLAHWWTVFNSWAKSWVACPLHGGLGGLDLSIVPSLDIRKVHQGLFRLSVRKSCWRTQQVAHYYNFSAK